MDPKEGDPMRTIRSLLNIKGYEIWSTTPDTLVFDALKVMAEKEIGALLVLVEGKLAGIFSERDYARKVILKGKSSKLTPVRDIMNYRVITITPDEPVKTALALMNEKHIRHLPVMEGGRLVGIVSIGDLVNAIIAEQNELIDKLEGYILKNSSLT
jgi:CBS domain-containing protein